MHAMLNIEENMCVRNISIVKYLTYLDQKTLDTESQDCERGHISYFVCYSSTNVEIVCCMYLKHNYLYFKLGDNLSFFLNL